MSEIFDVRPSAGLFDAERRPFRLAIGALFIVLEIAAIALAQTSALVGAAALVALAVAQVFAAMRLDGGIGKLLVLASTISLAAAGTIAAAPMFDRKFEQVTSDYLMEKGGPLGWTMEPSGGAVKVTKLLNGKPLFTQTYTLDDDGFRQTISAERGPAVTFLGDSFTFGEGVADSETMPQVFADRTGRSLRVVNAGVSAYSPAQVLRELELGLYDQRLKPAKALFMLTIDWHAARVACVHDSLIGAPRYESRDGTVSYVGTCGPVPPPSTLAGRLLAATPLYKALFGGGLRHVGDDEIQTYIDVVGAIARLAKSKYGVPLHVLYLRNPSYLVFNRFSDDKIMDGFRKGGAIVYDLTLPQEGRGAFAIPLDGHPTALAQRLHAEMLVDALRRNEPELLKVEAQTN